MHKQEKSKKIVIDKRTALESLIHRAKSNKFEKSLILIFTIFGL